MSKKTSRDNAELHSQQQKNAKHSQLLFLFIGKVKVLAFARILSCQCAVGRASSLLKILPVSLFCLVLLNVCIVSLHLFVSPISSPPNKPVTPTRRWMEVQAGSPDAFLPTLPPLLHHPAADKCSCLGWSSTLGEGKKSV